MGASRSRGGVYVWMAVSVCLVLGFGTSAWAATRTVSVQDTQFVDPLTGTSTTNITADDNITWSWGAGTLVGHTTTSGACLPCTGDGRWNSGNLSQTTGTFTVPVGTFSAPGSYPYYCELHTTSMTGVVNVSPGALHHFDVIASVTTITAGNSFNVTVTAKDQFNNTITGYGGTVHLDSNDANDTMPANNTLISGSRLFTGVILRTAGTWTITANDTVQTSKTGTDTVTVNPAGVNSLALTVPGTVSANTAFLATVTARDAFNNVATSYAGTVHFTSSDLGATLPANNTLVSGSRTFNVTFATPGSQSLTVTDVGNGALTDTENVTVNAACSVIFSNGAAITINDVTSATPYPSSIVVGGLKQTISTMSVTINGMSHTFPNDVDIMLEKQGGPRMVIMSDTGGGNDLNNLTFTLTDSAASPLPDLNGTITAGSFRPADYVAGGDTFLAPAPATFGEPAPTGSATFASTFGGIDPNGTWNLYVMDNVGGDVGSISGGWTLTFGPPPNTFCNQASITINDAAAGAPYPSTINVSGLDGTIKNTSVRLSDITHAFARDINVLLVGPQLQKMIIMADAGGNNRVSNATVTLDDAGSVIGVGLPSGVFKPIDVSDGSSDTFPAPAPAAPYADPAPTGTATLGATFNGTNPNGTWSLFVMDDLGGGAGSISGGWALNFDIRYNTTTALVSSSNPGVVGPSINLTATVTSSGPGTPTGTVTFKNGATSIGTVALSGGVATLPIQFVPGTYNITATYNGDANFNPSPTSNTVVQVINPGPTATGIAGVPNPSTFGQTVTFTATVTDTSAPFTPTGTVTFKDGLTVLGTTALNVSAVATFTTTATALTGGSHSITAVYNGDANFATSTSTILTQTVNKATTTIAVTSGTNPSTYGSSVTFTATVSDSTTAVPTGNVTFKDGVTTIGTTALNGSAVATLPISTLTAAGSPHSITAVYNSDTNFATSTSPAITQTVNKATPTASVISFNNPSTFGDTVTFRADVLAVGAGVTPTGNVTFKDGLSNLGTIALQPDGSAQFNTASLSGGSHNITVTYNGDGNYNTANSSPPLVQQVNAADTATAVGSSLNPSTFSQNVTFTATVTSSAGTPGGTVTFKDGLSTLGTSPLNVSGQATLLTSALSAGGHSITAVYNGNANFATSTSAPLAQTVNQASTTTTVISSSNPSTFGGSVTFTATVNDSVPGNASGTVTFKDGGTTIGTGALNGASPPQATFSTVLLTAGGHSITAVYAGNANFTTSTSSILTQNVNQSGTIVKLNSTNATSRFREAVIFTASVVSTTSGTPTGTVTFLDGATTIGSASLDGSGQGQITVTGMTVGEHTITVQYGGDSNFPANTSPPLVHYQSARPH